MGNINFKNRTKISLVLFLSLVGFVVVFNFREKNTRVFKIHTNPTRDKDRNNTSTTEEIFMVSNPPESIGFIIIFYQREIKRLSSINYKKIMKHKKSYYSVYFKERFFFDRDYVESSPSYGRVFDIMDIFKENYSVETSHADDCFITITFKENLKREDAPITPYLFINKWNLYYFPEGLKNNPNIHWKMYVKSKRGSYFDENFQF